MLIRNVWWRVERRMNLQDFHIFGYPVYVLDLRLCNDGKTPKFNPRDLRDIYIRISSDHAINIYPVFNTETGSVSPQYHNVYDDEYTSVKKKSDVDISKF